MRIRFRSSAGLVAREALIAITLVLWTAGARAEGINFAFDDCSPAGVSCKSFACNANTGPSFPIVASFVPPAGITDFVGVAAYIDIQSSSEDLPDWWKHGVGQCRGTSGLAMSFDFTSGPFTCTDVTFGYGTGGFAYNIGMGGPDRAWLQVQYAVPIDLAAPLDPDVEYYSFKVNLLRSKTTGTGSCTGCDVPMTLRLDSLRVYQDATVGFDPLLTTPLVSTVVDWQGQACPVTYPIAIDARELSEPSIVVSNSIECLDATTIQNVELTAGSHSVGGCEGGGPIPFSVDGSGNVSYDPGLEGLLGGAGTSTLVVHGHPVDVNTTAIPDESWRLSIAPTCYDGGAVSSFRFLPGAYSFGFCSGLCPNVGSLPGMAFGVNGSGFVTYDPILEGALSGAGTATLTVSSPPFPPAGDDVSVSLGKFRVVVEPEFWSLMEGYPGYAVVNGVHRLTSPLMIDLATTVGRSGVHRHGDAADVGGTPVGSAGTLVSDASFTFEPPDFQGPNGTPELHTEIRTLNLRNYAMTHGLRAGTAAPDRAISPGEIQANPSASGLFPGASFFDVFLEIDLPLLGTLHNPEPLMIENSDITCFPPEVFFLARRTGPVSMVFKANDTEMPPRWLAGQRFGWMVLAGLASNFDTTGAALSLAWNGEGGPARLGDPFAEFEQVLEAEPEMADSATVVVDVIDVVTYSDPTAFVEPDLRDSVLAGIDRAAELGQSGNPCAGTEIIVQLYLRTDGVPDPDDWVTDPTVRAVLAERIHEVGAILQRQADEVGGCGVLAAPEPELAGTLAIVAIRPNPSLGAVHVDYAIPVEGQVSVAIYDLAGRLVSRLVDGYMPAGRHRVTWSGDPGPGSRSSSGIYFALLKSSGHSAVKRLVVVR